MKKPLIVAKEDFEKSIKELVNNSELPVIILEPIIKDIYSTVLSAYRSQLKDEHERYLSEINNTSN